MPNTRVKLTIHRLNLRTANHTTTDSERLSDERGRFEFVEGNLGSWVRFDVRRDGYVDLASAVRDLPPGKLYDVGDVVMLEGAEIRGRVIDSNGAPQGDVMVSFARSVPVDEQIGRRFGLAPRPLDRFKARTASDGTFATGERAAPGTWLFGVVNRHVVGERRFTIEVGDRIKTIEITIKSPGDIETVAGVVVDETGEPVEHAHFKPSTALLTSRTNEAGEFRLERAQGMTGLPVTLQFEKFGYEDVVTDPIPWRTEDLRIVMRRGVGMTVTVRAARTGLPIEHFVARATPKPGSVTGSISSNQFRIITEGTHHPGGVAEITGMKRGSYQVWIEPEDGDWVQPDVVDVELVDGSPSHVLILLDETTERRLRVLAAGEPVEKAVVSLLQPLADHPVDSDTTVRSAPTDYVFSSSSNQARQIASAVTAADGSTPIRAPGESITTLRVTSKDHPTLFVRDIRLANTPDPWIVEMPIGCSVVGRIEPADLVPQLFTNRPPVVLVRRIENGSPVGMTTGHGEVQRNGSFRIGGLSPGDWQVLINYAHPGTPRNSHFHQNYPLGTVLGLASGEERELHPRLPQLAHMPVRGRVLVNGQPHRGPLELSGVCGELDGDRSFLVVMCDAEGRFEFLGRAGTWDARLPQATTYRLDALEPIEVRAGEPIDVKVRFVTGRFDVRLVNQDGEPVADAQLVATRSGAEQRLLLPPSDDDGRVVARMDADTFDLHVLTKGAEGQDGLIPLTTFTVDNRNDVPIVDLVLPAASGY